MVDEMKIHCSHDELVRVSELKPHPKNRNQHPKEQITRLARILKFQGWRNPVKVSKLSGYVTSGHGRISAAKENGWEYVPVNFQDYEDETQEYADVTSDNAIASWAELDLGGINNDVVDLGPDFDIDLLGIEGFVLEPADKHHGDADDVPPVPEVATTKPGDLFSLGDHRLLCGDATSREDVERLMNGEKADMVFTDPPYNVDYDYSFHEDNKTDEEYLTWTKEWVARVTENTKNDAWFWIKNAPRNLPGFWPIGLAEKWALKNLVVWPHPSSLFPSNRFQDSWDSLTVLGSGKPVFNSKAQVVECGIPLSQGGGTHLDGRIGDVWSGIKYISAGAMASKEAVLKPGTKSKAHPCQMPLALPERAVLFCSNETQTVYEPFCGSGSTLIACEKTNRRCFGLEIDPLYCDVIIKRWETFTGKKAVLIEKAG